MVLLLWSNFMILENTLTWKITNLSNRPNVWDWLLFDRVNDYVQLPAIPTISWDASIAISCIVKVPTAAFQCIVKLWVFASWMNFSIFKNNNWSIWVDYFNSSIQTFTAYWSEELHIVAQKTPWSTVATTQIYINWILQPTYLWAWFDLIPNFSFLDCTIWNRYNNYHTWWQVFDLKIFNRTISQEEITTLYNTKWQWMISTLWLIADYRFDSRQWFILKDQSINLNNGSLVNYTAWDTTLWATNKRVDQNWNPILSL